MAKNTTSLNTVFTPVGFGGTNSKSLIAQSTAKTKFKGIAAQYLETGDISKKAGYRSTLSRMISNSLKGSKENKLKTLKKFETALIKHGLAVGLSDKDLMPFNKYYSIIKNGSKINAEYSYDESRSPAYNYMLTMTDFLIQLHYKKAEEARELYKKYGHGHLSVVDLDVSKYSESARIQGTAVTLDEFLEGLTHEASLYKKAREDYYVSKSTGEGLTYKQLKHLNWVESWYVNFKYSLARLGWNDVIDLLNKLAEAGVDVSTLYDKIYKGSDYDLVFEYREAVGDSYGNSSHSALLADLQNLLSLYKK